MVGSGREEEGSEDRAGAEGEGGEGRGERGGGSMSAKAMEGEGGREGGKEGREAEDRKRGERGGSRTESIHQMLTKALASLATCRQKVDLNGRKGGGQPQWEGFQVNSRCKTCVASAH